jgi:O-antigen/teichoic acid export membrane protein
MKLAKNIISNYLNQGWIALANIISIPLYINILGTNSIGLIGFFTALQGIFSILDLGFAPIISQENKKAQLNKISQKSFYGFIKTTNFIYLVISIFIFICLYTYSLQNFHNWEWFASASLNKAYINNFAVASSLMIAARYFETYYRSLFIGLEFFHDFNFINFFVVFFRNFGPLLIFNFLNPNLIAYFYFQFLLSILVSFIFYLKIYKFKFKKLIYAKIDLREILKRKKLIIDLFKASILSVIITQADKMLLALYLNIEQYSYFILATTISAGVSMLIAPITQVIYPKLTKAFLQSNHNLLSEEFHFSAQLVTLLIGTLSLSIILFRHEILFLWTSNQSLADKTSLYLGLFVFGSLTNALLWVPYQLQIAMGWMKLSLITNFLAILIMIPLYIVFLPKYGINAAAYIWIGLNLFYFIFSVNIMFSKILITERFSWYIFDVLLPLSYIFGVLFLLRQIFLNSFLIQISLFITLPIIYLLTIIFSFWIFSELSLKKFLNG